MSDALPYKTRHKGTGVPLWSDGIHFVRPASIKDRHKLRFVVVAHRVTASDFKRHAPTQERAIEIAKAATAAWIKAHPADRAYLQILGTPETTEASPSSKVVLQPFATTLFDCVYANPVAQVWMMTRSPGEYKPVGRRTQEGRAATPTPVPHTKGECAVMRGAKPVWNDDGSVRVFPSQSHAEEFADDLYRAEPEENTISWRDGHVRVAATERVEVHFNPAVYGTSKPFVLWLPQYERVVFVDHTRPTIRREGVSLKSLEESDPQLALDTKVARARASREDRQPSFEDRPLRFRSISAALEEADRREKMLRGETVR